MSTTVLVAGGAGYIGSHTCKALARAGYLPVVVDNLVHGHADAVRWGPLEKVDILDGDRLDQVFTRYRPDVVMHFAAYAYVGESVIEPEKYYTNNVLGSLSLFSSMRRAGVDKLVFSSSCATYGIPERMPITETTPQLPINPYGRTKLIIEQVLSDYNRAYDLQSVTLRYFNAAGCDPDGELGERHHPETHAIPLAIRAALGTGPRFRIFGSDYPTPDGTAIRDYVHVSDLADAHVKAVDYLLRGNGSRIFNLATGRGTSVKELLTAVERVTGKVVPMEYLPRREGDPPQLFATSQTAKDSLEWSPQYLNIDETVATAARWFTSAWISN